MLFDKSKFKNDLKGYKDLLFNRPTWSYYMIVMYFLLLFASLDPNFIYNNVDLYEGNGNRLALILFLPLGVMYAKVGLFAFRNADEDTTDEQISLGSMVIAFFLFVIFCIIKFSFFN